MLPPGFYWEPNHHKPGALWLLRRNGHLVVGGVWPRLDGNWMAAINRHRFRYPTAVAPRREVAIRWVERWCRARAAALATVERELAPGEVPPPAPTWNASPQVMGKAASSRVAG